MLKLLAVAALVVGIGAGAAGAQTVADIGMAGEDPRSGKAPKQAVIFFHGYTQRGSAMKALADTLAKRLPDAAFIFNDGPLEASGGRSWYVLRGEDTENTRAKAKQVATDTVRKVSEGLGVPYDQIVVVGFSQGGGVAFDGGSCVSPDVNGDCKAEDGAKANVLIVYNDSDPTVSRERIQQFQDTLKAGGYASQLETFPGAAHWPVAAGLIRAQDFIVEQLSE
jgi:predicted esterase